MHSDTEVLDAASNCSAGDVASCAVGRRQVVHGGLEWKKAMLKSKPKVPWMAGPVVAAMGRACRRRLGGSKIKEGAACLGIAIVGCLTLIVAGRSGRRKWLEKKEAERRRKAEAERRLKREQLL